MLQLFLLGIPEIRIDGRRVIELTSAKARATLFYLAMEGRRQSRLAISGLLWPDKSERLGRVSLRQTLSQLRRTVGQFVEADRDSVWLNPSLQCDVDALLFQRSALAGLGGDVAALREAADLYGDDFLADFYVEEAPEFEMWQLQVRERLRTTALEVLQALVQSYIQSNQNMPALHVIRRVLEIEPWHEESYRLSMRLLAEDGQRTAALAQYEACRQVLEADLGIEPSDETKGLYESIRAGEFLMPGLDDTWKATQLKAVNPHNLPRHFSPFVGREDSIQQLSRWLKDPTCALITIRGIGGMGKTRLAVETARKVLPAFPDGAWFTDLSPLNPADNLYVALANGLNLELTGRHGIKNQILNYLRNKDLLLILDNFEHMKGQVTALTSLLRECRGVKILVTSRENLELQAEWLFEIRGLSVPDADEDTPSVSSAVNLFLTRVSQWQPGLEPAPEALPVVGRICRLLDGVPLAIELAVSLVRVSSYQEIADALEQDVDELVSTLADTPARQRGMRAVFEYSWRLLSDVEQVILSRLSVFRGSFTTPAAGAVALIQEKALTNLEHKSFLISPLAGRWQIHELLQQYAAEKARLLDQYYPALDAHEAYYLTFLQEQSPRLRSIDGQLAKSEIERDRPNIIQAWRRAIQVGDIERLEGAQGALVTFCVSSGLFEMGQQLMREASGHIRQLPEAGEARVSALVARLESQQALFFNMLARYDDAIGLARQAFKRAEGAGDPLGRALGLRQWATGLAYQGQYGEALELDEQALAIARLAKDPFTQANVLSGKGIHQLHLGDYQKAIASLEEALAIYRELDDVAGESGVQNNLAVVYLRQGSYKKTRDAYERALHLYSECGDQGGVHLVGANLGIVALHQGSYSQAEELLSQSLRFFRHVGDRWRESALINSLGAVALHLGDYESAEQRLRQGLTLAKKIGNRYSEAEILINLSRLALARDEFARALELITPALEIAQDLGEETLTALGWFGLGRVKEALNEAGEARDAYCRARDAHKNAGQRGMAAEASAGLARLDLARGRRDEALLEVNTILPILTSPGSGVEHDLDGAGEPLRIFMTCYDLLKAMGDDRARNILIKAYEFLQEREGHIDDPRLRHSYIERVSLNRQIAEEYKAYAD